MCRLLGYLGSPIPLDFLLNKPEHSLVVQSYQPQEMTSGVVNADGFGIGWYHPQRETLPFTYKNTLPIWNDINLASLSRYIESGCILASVRSATAGQPLDFSNSQPFNFDRLTFIHNGLIENFRQSLFRPIRDRLNDTAYQLINGTTDSEHMFALFVDFWQASPQSPLEQVLQKTLATLGELSDRHQVKVSANIILTDGHRLVASRFAKRTSPPSLYWLQDDPSFPSSILIASEPLFVGDWVRFEENSILSVGEDRAVHLHSVL